MLVEQSTIAAARSANKGLHSVLIVDDHALIRQAVRELVTGLPSVGVVDEAHTADEALAKFEAYTWDLVILDIHLPSRSGIEVLCAMKERRKSTRVLVLSGFPERQFAVNVLRFGASAYLGKDAPSDELSAAVNALLSGRRYVSPSVASALLDNLGQDVSKPLHERLSKREWEVFQRLAKGEAVSAIAADLALSIKTVSTYRGRILDKFTFKSNADITTYALRNGLMA